MPNSPTIFERANGVIYSRGVGSVTRTEVFSEDEEGRKWKKINEEYHLWEDIRETAKSHPALQKSLDNAIILYRLIKDNPV